jgi:hypothetical protein
MPEAEYVLKPILPTQIVFPFAEKFLGPLHADFCSATRMNFNAVV